MQQHDDDAPHQHDDDCNCEHDAPELSEGFEELVLLALEHAMGSIDQGGPLIPFALVERDGTREVRRFVAPTMEESLEEARKAVRALKPAPDRVALAYDGFLQMEDEQVDTILVEGFEAGAAATLVFAQPYTPATEDAELEPLEDPFIVGEHDPLF